MKICAVFVTLLALAVPARAQDHTGVVTAVKAQLVAAGADLSGPCGAFAITGRVAWALRAEGWGLFSKGAGQNGCSVAEGRFGIDALQKPDGSAWVDLLINAETDNTPAWQVQPGSGVPPAMCGTPQGWCAPFELDSVQPPDPPSTSTDHEVMIDFLAEQQTQTAAIATQMTAFRAWAEQEIAEVRAEHKQQSGAIDGAKTPWWQIIVAIVGAIGGGVGATR